MIDVPDRITGLIERLEAGEEPSPTDLRRLATLQALDMAKAGHEFMREMVTRDEQRTQEYKQWLDSL